jgi:hypothetical protein
MEDFDMDSLNMNFSSMLETMAANAATEKAAKVSRKDIERWMHLFGFSPADAKNKIEGYRSDLSREGVSNEIWTEIAADMEASGWDRESYAYSLKMHKHTPRPAPTASKGKFLIKLDDFLALQAQRQEALMAETAKISEGKDEDGKEEAFVTVNGSTRDKLVAVASAEGRRLTVIKINIASKALSVYSRAPTLGVDATLPQYRLDAPTDVNAIRPQQNEYPIWYFFYGTLADPEVLSKVLDLPKHVAPMLCRASVTGAKLRTWGCKYRAFVDDFAVHGPSSVVQGCAYWVKTKAQEDALRVYETENYDVVRCSITMKVSGLVVPGLTFRFAAEDSLDAPLPLRTEAPTRPRREPRTPSAEGTETW